MTTPPSDTNPPPASTPPSSTEPPRPIVVNAPDSGVRDTLAQMGQQLAALPEAIVNSFREATQTQQQQQSTPPAASGSQNQPAASLPQDQNAMDQNAMSVGKKGPGKLAQWWFTS